MQVLLKLFRRIAPCFILSALFFASFHVSVSAVPAWVNDLAVGQWYQIPNTAMSSVVPSPVPSGNSPSAKVTAWTSFVTDTRTSKVYSVANGGHNDYSGNEVDVLDLDRDVPLWSQVLAPTPNSQLTNCQSYYGDGRPVSRHTYYGVTLDVFNDRIMLFGGAKWCSGGGFHNAVSSYNIAANSYNPAGTHPDQSATSLGSYHAMTANPLTGDVYQFPSGIAYKWTRSTNSWNTLGSNSISGYESMSAFDTTRKRILIVGGDNSTHHTYTPAGNTLAAVTLGGANASSVASARQGGMAYVPAIDRFLVRLAAAGGTVYQIDPSTFEVTTYGTTGGTSIPSIPNGPYNKFLYVPRLGGMAYVPSYTGNAWFLKTNVVPQTPNQRGNPSINPNAALQVQALMPGSLRMKVPQRLCSSNATIGIFNIAGKKLYSGAISVSAGEARLAGVPLPVGIYSLDVKSNGLKGFAKFVVTR